MQLETLSEQKRKSKTVLHVFLKTITFMTMPKCINDMMKTRPIKEQLRLKLRKNLRTTRLDQHLMVLILKKACSLIS